MRTTISIDDHLLRAAKQRALEREMTLGHVIEDALHLALDPAREDGVDHPPLPVSKHRGGTRPGVDVSNGVGLRDLMDEA